MADYAAAYSGTRQRVTDLVEGLDDDRLNATVPTCPDWAVRDVVAHVTGIVSDIAAGNLKGVGSDEWTAVQVEARRGLSFPEILHEWAEKAPPIETMLAGAPPQMGASLVGDLVTHEQDIRGALGAPGGREGEAMDIAVERYVEALRDRASGLAPLRIVTQSREWVLGEGEPAATVEGEPFHLLRALTGRRSADQIRSLFTEGDPEPWVGVFSAYGLPDAPTEE